MLAKKAASVPESLSTTQDNLPEFATGHFFRLPISLFPWVLSLSLTPAFQSLGPLSLKEGRSIGKRNLPPTITLISRYALKSVDTQLESFLTKHLCSLFIMIRLCNYGFYELFQQQLHFYRQQKHLPPWLYITNSRSEISSITSSCTLFSCLIIVPSFFSAKLGHALWRKSRIFSPKQQGPVWS